MSSRGTLEQLVEGGFRALLICSAIYFGAKYAPYVMKVADNVKEKIMPGATLRANYYTIPNEQKEIPQSLEYTDPKLYNAILIDRFVFDCADVVNRSGEKTMVGAKNNE